jgi:hypothetical protein
MTALGAEERRPTDREILAAVARLGAAIASEVANPIPAAFIITDNARNDVITLAKRLHAAKNAPLPTLADEECVVLHHVTRIVDGYDFGEVGRDSDWPAHDLSVAAIDASSTLENLGVSQDDIITMCRGRLLAGQQAYGPLDLANDRRKFTNEIVEELVDTINYAAMACVQEELRLGAATLSRLAPLPAIDAMAAEEVKRETYSATCAAQPGCRRDDGHAPPHLLTDPNLREGEWIAIDTSALSPAPVTAQDACVDWTEPQE